MPHNHSHDNTEKSLRYGLIINGGFTIVEFVAGVLTGSLALIADATHNLTDCITMLVSYIANKIAGRKPNIRKTYGYGRITIIAALLNATIMLGVASYIGYEAVQRFFEPKGVDGGIIMIVAGIGVIVNSSIAWLLSRNKQDLNIKSAYIDLLFDALSSVGAVIAGLIILLTGFQYADTIVAVIIAGLLLYNVVNIIKEALHILLEGTPDGINLDVIRQAMLALPKVIGVDDMHAWAIRSNYNALSCHVVISEADLKNSRVVVEDIKSILREQYDIQHATIEIELEDCVAHPEHTKHQ